MFKETFYWLYQYWYKRNPKDQPYYNAYLGVLLFQILNLITIGAFARKFVYESHYDKSASIFAALTILVILSLIDFFFLYKRREGIIEEVGTYPAADLLKSKKLYKLYIILSLITCFSLLILND